MGNKGELPLQIVPRRGRFVTQSAKAFIRRRGKGNIYQSHVIFKGKEEVKSTGSKSNSTALDYNLLHLMEVIKCHKTKR